MNRRLTQAAAALLTIALAVALGACGDSANNNDNMSGTATAPGSSGQTSPGNTLPGGSDGTGGGGVGNSGGGTGNPGP
jgi:hypothetical protein